MINDKEKINILDMYIQDIQNKENEKINQVKKELESIQDKIKSKFSEFVSFIKVFRKRKQIEYRPF